MPSANRYILLVGCSKRKRRDPDLLPAIERYDGPTFRMLRKAMRENRIPTNLDVLILSAHYGLIEASSSIGYYERRMTGSRAHELAQSVSEALRALIDPSLHCHIYVDLGQDYRAALPALNVLTANSEVTFGRGRIGTRLAHLRSWLQTLCQSNGPRAPAMPRAT